MSTFFVQSVLAFLAKDSNSLLSKACLRSSHLQVCGLRWYMRKGLDWYVCGVCAGIHIREFHVRNYVAQMSRIATECCVISTERHEKHTLINLRNCSCIKELMFVAQSSWAKERLTPGPGPGLVRRGLGGVAAAPLLVMNHEPSTFMID